MKCVGIKVGKPGKYEGYDYHNVYLHCVTPFDPGDTGQGDRVETVKVAFVLFDRLGLSPDQLLGEEIDIAYDRYGRVMRIDLR